MTTPLDRIERYLWKRYNKFPHYDEKDHHPPKTDLHVYYEEGWGLIHHLKSLLFECSSSFGNFWPWRRRAGRERLFSIHCQHPGCQEWAYAIINETKTGKRIKRHGRLEYEFKSIPNAPLFLCLPHSHELTTGEKYVPPTDEETNRMSAMFRATERILKERPPQPLDLDCGLRVDSHITMDEDYLRRLSVLAEEEYRKLTVIH